MQRKIIKSVRGQTLGFIATDDHGRKSARNVRGQLLGRYDPHNDLTKDQLKSHGDTLPWLIGDD